MYVPVGLDQVAAQLVVVGEGRSNNNNRSVGDGDGLPELLLSVYVLDRVGDVVVEFGREDLLGLCPVPEETSLVEQTRVQEDALESRRSDRQEVSVHR